MDKDTSLSFTQVFFKNRFLYLLVFLLIMIAIDPLDEVFGRFGILKDLVLSVILVLAIYAISHKRHHVVIGVLLAVPMVVSMWSHVFGDYKWLKITGHICGIAFFAFIIVAILRFIFSQDEITRDLIAGAAVVYIFIAALWAFAYRLIEMIHPGSFSIPQGQGGVHTVNAIYYSLVTLTTLGYGDITPVTNVAKTCSTLEAVIGQLYLVVTVAWLVGIYVSQSIEKKSR